MSEDDSRLRELYERMRVAPVREAYGVVDRIAGFDDSTSITLAPWRWKDGKIEKKLELYVRGKGMSSDELREMWRAFPVYSVVRVSVRPDVGPSEHNDIWDAMLEEIVLASDPELDERAAKLKDKEARVKVGSPPIDLKWSFVDFLSRFVAAPVDLPIVRLGTAFDASGWSPDPEGSPFDQCDGFVKTSPRGTMKIGVRDGKIEGALYDLSEYRETGPRMMAKLRALLRAHGESGELVRFIDNHAGAMMYRNQSGDRFAIYFYNVDRFAVHTPITAFDLR